MEHNFSPYTDNPSEGSFVVFPSHAHQILSSFIQILGARRVHFGLSNHILMFVLTLPGASLLAYCFARRTDSENLSSRSGWAQSHLGQALRHTPFL